MKKQKRAFIFYEVLKLCGRPEDLDIINAEIFFIVGNVEIKKATSCVRELFYSLN
jgi:hypothetical protein